MSLTTRASAPREVRSQAGFTIMELVIATGVTALLMLAAIMALSGTLQQLRVVSASSTLWAQARTGVNRAVEEIKGADSTDNDATYGFSVSSTMVRFRAVTGMNGSGQRTFGNGVKYEITGPVSGEGNTTMYQLVRTERNTSSGALVGRTVIMSNLTSPTDAASPSKFTYESPYQFVTIQLVEKRTAEKASAAGTSTDVTAGVKERVRIRF